MTNATENKPATSKEIQNLVDVIATLPTEYQNLLAPHVKKVAEKNHRRHRLNKLIQEALTQLRLDIKYLEFDLQATRAERDELQAELDSFEDFE